MNSSIEKNQKSTPTTSEEITLHHMTGLPVKNVRGEGGRYVKQIKKAESSKNRKERLRNLLDRPEPNEDGRIEKGSKSRYHRMVENQIKNAMMDAERPVFDKLGFLILDTAGEIVKVVDPKVMMASTAAFKELMLRADGMPSKSDEDLDALKTQGVKIVILQHPEIMDKNVYEDKPRETLKPAFIEGEFVENK
jgi:hypothetical protein